ncbi:MAG: rod shape-determining protein RodA [Anaerolineae bacterium]|jgi:rod shape determining protein RodA|nr:rod shape-determining protein RodA [Anaerolineae bacterium]
MREPGSFWQRFDFILLGAVSLLVVFGILMIASATRDAVDPDLVNRVPDQIRFAAVGFVALLALAALDYRLLAGLSTWLYLVMMILLLLVLLLGVEGDAGAQRWLNIGIRIQPSEIGKIIIIITLANFLATRYKDLDKFPTVIASLIHLAGPTVLIFLQPNLGTTIVFVVIWGAIIWGAGLRLRHILMLIGIVLLTLPLLFTQLRAYQLSRITTFLDPAADPDAQYNIDQALVSIGSGGLLGKGYAAGSQNTGRFLRVRHTDFIFSVIAHEFGMIGGLSVMALIGVVLSRILRGARLAIDPLGSMICYGVAGMIFFQTVVSIGMNLNVMPVTGLVLPFVSSGGTSLLFTMIGVGLVQSVIVRRRRIKN